MRVGRSASVAFSAVALGVLGAGLSTAQAETSPVSELIDKIAKILEILQPAPGPVRLSTAPALAFSSTATCLAVNLGNTPLHVNVTIVGSDASVFANHTVDVQPGRSSGVLAGPFGFESMVHCEIAFDGLASDVRASMHMRDDLTGQYLVSLDAR